MAVVKLLCGILSNLDDERIIHEERMGVEASSVKRFKGYR
jgi:hypothetical protein